MAAAQNQKNNTQAAGGQPAALACKNTFANAPTGIAPALLAWYEANKRQLPFRANPTPYNVWVSEIMLQQTRMEAAVPYYERFTAALPDAAALAECDEEQLLKLWQGLGYYSRARNLQKAARLVVARHGGRLPADYEALKELPGIGDYTAGAIASIAFGLPCPAVDGNVLRVASRLAASEADAAAPATKKQVAAWVRGEMPQDAPGAFTQALFELGALVCKPKTPNCAACPLAARCRGFAAGTAASLPRKAPKKAKQAQHFCVLLVYASCEAAGCEAAGCEAAGCEAAGCDGNAEKKLLLQQRPATGLLAGLWQPVLLPGPLNKAQAKQALASLLPGVAITMGEALPKATHVFTHRVWLMAGWACTVPGGTPPPGPQHGHWQFATLAQLQSQLTLPGAFAAYLPTAGAPAK